MLRNCRYMVDFQFKSKVNVSLSKEITLQKLSVYIIRLSASHLEKARVTYCVFQIFQEIDRQHQHQTQLVSNSCYYCSGESLIHLVFMKEVLFIATHKYYFSKMLNELNPRCSQLKKGPIISYLECNFLLQVEIYWFGGCDLILTPGKTCRQFDCVICLKRGRVKYTVIRNSTALPPLPVTTRGGGD